MRDSHNTLNAIQATVAGFTNARERLIAEEMLLGGFTPIQQEQHVVVLLHGMNTYAEWQEALAEPLRNHTTLEPVVVGYGNLHPFKFFLPWPYRQKRINIVLDDLRGIRARFPDAKISIVAHSFGTYIFSQILSKTSDLRFHRVILCGSIIDSDFNWSTVQNRLSSPVVNDIGLRDHWPALAKNWSVGYGDSGCYGFKKSLVRDRFFDLDHSGFLQKNHMQQYWLPFLVDGRVVPSKINSNIPKPKFYITELRRLSWMHVIAIFCIVVFLSMF